MAIQQVDFNLLRDAALFAELPENALRMLAPRCRYVELAAGETLFQQDDPGDALYVLIEGQVHVVRRYAEGDEVILATEGPYYVIGDLSALVNQPRTGSVIAVSDCTLIAVKRDDLMWVCDQEPSVPERMLEHLGRRLYRMNLMVREAAVGNVAARVANVVLLLCGGASGRIPLEVRVTRLARAVAAHTDEVDHVLNDWIKGGFIGYDGRTLTIKQLAPIEEIAG